jgi:hypothetical protein
MVVKATIPDATTTDVLVGGGGDGVAADAAIGITDNAATVADGSDTFYAGYGSNIMIGGTGTNAFNIPTLYQNTGMNVIWGNGGVSTYDFTNNLPASDGQTYSSIYMVYIKNPTVYEVESISHDISILSGKYQIGTIIINPSENDKIMFNGTSQRSWR